MTGGIMLTIIEPNEKTSYDIPLEGMTSTIVLTIERKGWLRKRYKLRFFKWILADENGRVEQEKGNP